ncbi:M-phase inducer phosphatase 3 [Taenia crassiceps]|uniref:protein-tyrosine-phosphatase n=1 Tax=Taenia crassiceps TaxID=6207 RepID=A0ABR4QQC4_9CEST
MLVEYRYSSQYIDESANQEAPSLLAVLDSLTSASSFVHACEESAKDLHDAGSTLSSGYFSTSSQSSQQTYEMSDYLSRFDPTGYEGGLSRYLRRTQSSTHEESPDDHEMGQTGEGQSNASHQIHTSERSLKAYQALFGELPTICETQQLTSRNVRFAERSLPHSPARKRPRFASSLSGIFENSSQAADVGLNDTLYIPDIGGDASVPSVSSPLRPHNPGLDIGQKRSSPEGSPQPEISPIKKRTFSRCVSVPATIAKDQLSTSTGALGGIRKPSVLPVVEQTDTGVSLVSVDTVAHLLAGKYAKRNVNFLIVDCRFPYEYNGGHIKEAVNIYTLSDLVREVFHRIPAQNPLENEPFVHLGDQLDKMLAKENPNVSLPPVSEYLRSSSSSSDEEDESEESIVEDNPLEEKMDEKSDLLCVDGDADSPKSVEDESSLSTSSISGGSDPVPSYVIIFHCEFSSQRAPKMARLLRKLDRSSNFSRYPFLFFPELYVMKDGYAGFYKRFPDLCEPSTYMKMFHKSHKSELRYYRRLTDQVSNSCDATFRNPALFSLTLRSSSENKENEVYPLRKVHTMYAKQTTSPLSLHTNKRQKLTFGDESMTDIDLDDAQSPKRKLISSESLTIPSGQPTDIPDQSYLQIVEAVVRVGQHVIDTLERGWKQGRRSSTSKSSIFGTRPRQSSLQLTDSPPTPIRPRLRPFPLSFSSSESSGANSPVSSRKP